MNKVIRNAAKQIQISLKNNGYIVHRYNSYSTDSIYLKIDYGLGGSVRISDHAGKQYLNYTFNVLSDIEEYREEGGKYGKRYFIPISDMERVLELVQERVKVKQDKYGVSWYMKKLQEYEKADIKSLGKGFWEQAFRV